MYYIVCGSIVWTLSLLVALIGGIIHLLTLGRSKEWSRQNLISPLAKTLLQIIKVELEVEMLTEVPKEPVVYISNHASPFDLFAVAALAPPHTYYFLSKRTWFHLPLSALAFLSGVFYISSQSNPLSRELTFKRASRLLSKTQKNVLLTPEGRIILTGKIGHFNKGAFHLALALQRPIVCIYIEVCDLSGKRNYGLKGPLKCKYSMFKVISPSTSDISPSSIDELRMECLNAYKDFEGQNARL
jgi:1-acyl-sn-glycerol-3-phosphate acyltransferase